MKKAENLKLNDVKILRKDVSNFTVELEKGDEVQIIGIGERGYDLKHLASGEIVNECGWDLF
ncbi:hypothetical protein [Bacillus pumilus]|uniref:Uncharacterized protein n=1 Tax=Bacillus pumilus TaxID=1408 RepID=A0AAD0HNF6_BACPU|nr:hypothetical protein [Bacillus pumilus]AVM24288.1 hypothetical protein C5695_10745 [Bacillus pumilus]TYS42800.1 hypothetical protein FZC68_10345 [Bacillus pumilus]